MLLKQLGLVSGALTVVLACSLSGYAQQQDGSAGASTQSDTRTPYQKRMDEERQAGGAAPSGTKTAKKGDSAKPDKEARVKEPKEEKEKKGEYTDPMTVVELPPTPMLDEEGRQRLDPDGKPMFNPPVRQLRDSKGHPMFSASGKPLMQTADNLGYDEHGKKIVVKKEKPVKTVSLSIVHGTMTVDGMIGKAALNYDIQNLHYIYIYVPGIGTTIVSNAMFPGAKEQPNAFDDKTLTVKVEDHLLQINSDARLLGSKPESAFVAVDRSFAMHSKYPVVGYGELRVAPYAWPGAKQDHVEQGVVKAPPLPENLRPAMLLEPCPAGQMRLTAAGMTPAQASTQPCVPIQTATPSASTASPAGANSLK